MVEIAGGGRPKHYNNDIDIDSIWLRIEEHICEELRCSQTLGMILSRLGKKQISSSTEYYGNYSNYVDYEFSFDLMNQVYLALKDSI